MKQLILLIFLTVSIVFGQKTIFNTDFQSNTVATIDSKPINLSLDQRPQEAFGGLIRFSLDIDSTLKSGTFADNGTTADSVLYYIQYGVANDWVTGDTLNWYKVTSDEAFDDTTTWILPRTHHGWKMVSWISPSNGDAVIDNIRELPCGIIRIRCVTTDSCNFYNYLDYIKK